MSGREEGRTRHRGYINNDRTLPFKGGFQTLQKKNK